jgi:NAD(P)H dehydrogenase (quinone)
MILVTGVSGALGGLVHEGLAAQPEVAVLAGSRTAPAGGRRVDFDDPASLPAAFAGVAVLVFVSAGYAEDDVVLARHGAVVDAAAEAGVRQVIYTSLSGSGERMTIALAHRWTEARLAAAPFDVTVLRNGLYAEIPVSLALAAAGSVADTGVFEAPFGDGALPVVARADLAAVAVRVAAESDADLAAGRASRHAGRVYELEGEPVGGADVAAAFTEVLGRPVRYQSVGLGPTRAGLTASGLLEPYQVGHSVSTFSVIRAGLAQPAASDLPALLPTPPRPARDLLVDALAGVLASR